MPKNADTTILKCILTGMGNVGKSTFLTLLNDGIYNENISSTIGVAFGTINLEVDTRSTKLQVWDLAGNEKYKNMVKIYLRGGRIVFLCYDISSMDSFEYAKTWLAELKLEFERSGSQPVIFLLGLKSDLDVQREVTPSNAEIFAREQQLDGFIEISSKANADDVKKFKEIIVAPVRRALQNLNGLMPIAMGSSFVEDMQEKIAETPIEFALDKLQDPKNSVNIIAAIQQDLKKLVGKVSAGGTEVILESGESIRLPKGAAEMFKQFRNPELKTDQLLQAWIFILRDANKRGPGIFFKRQEATTQFYQKALSCIENYFSQNPLYPVRKNSRCCCW